MKITKKQLRRLIQEALSRIPILKPVTRQELDQIRAQSRSQAGIDSELQGELQGLELTGSSEYVNQARNLAQALGSKHGEIKTDQEDDFLRAQLIHELLPLYESFFGKQRMFQFEPRFLELLKKFYETSQTPGEFRVVLEHYGMFRMTVPSGSPQPLQETHDKILKKLGGLDSQGEFSYNQVSYIISAIGPAGGGGLVGADSNAIASEWAQLQRFIADECNNRGLNPPIFGYHIYKMALAFRPDLKTYVDA